MEQMILMCHRWQNYFVYFVRMVKKHSMAQASDVYIKAALVLSKEPSFELIQ